MKRLLLVTLLAACSRDGPATVTFGAAGPWAQGYGDMSHKGIELAVSQINSLAERRSHPLQIMWANDKADGQEARRIAQLFVNSPQVLAVIGHVNSGAMAAAALVYDGHLAAVATSATSPVLTGISPWAFRLSSSDSVNGIDMARFAARLGRTRAAILYENNTDGRGLSDAFQHSFTGTVVSIDPIAEGADQSFEAYVAFFKQVHADILFVAGTDASGLALLKEVRRQELDVTLLGGDGWSGMSVDTARSTGVYLGVPFAATDPRPDAQRFVIAFRARFGMKPDNNAALAYDATRLLYKAYSDVGGDRRRIRDWLASRTATTAYRGATGAIWFRPDGDPVGKSVVMTRIERGVLRVVGGAT